MEKYRASHREMLQVIDQLSDEELRKPYIEYLPAGSDGPHAPVYHWISGNTYDHVDEHIRWINDILKSQGTKEEINKGAVSLHLRQPLMAIPRIIKLISPTVSHG